MIFFAYCCKALRQGLDEHYISSHYYYYYHHHHYYCCCCRCCYDDDDDDETLPFLCRFFFQGCRFWVKIGWHPLCATCFSQGRSRGSAEPAKFDGKSFIEQPCSVKMIEYLPHSFLRVYGL